MFHILKQNTFVIVMKVRLRWGEVLKWVSPIVARVLIGHMFKVNVPFLLQILWIVNVPLQFTTQELYLGLISSM